MKHLCMVLALATGIHVTKGQDTLMVTPLERGHMRGGNRVGNWEYHRTPLVVDLRVDYDNGRILYIEPDTSDFTVKVAGGWAKRKLDIPCRPHGPWMHQLEHYEKRFLWPQELLERAIKKKVTIDVWLTFEVQPDGLSHNPQVINDPGFGVKELLLGIYENAPPWWIVGVLPDGSPATCRMAYRYVLCVDGCYNLMPVPDAKVLRTMKVINNAAPSPRSHAFRGLEQVGIQFSPNGQKLLVDLATIYKDERSAVQWPLVIDLNNKLIESIDFGLAAGAWWKSDNEIYFRFEVGRSAPVLGRKDLATGHIEALSDSSVYGVQFSPDRSKMVYSTIRRDDRIDVCLFDFATGKTRVILGNLSDPTVSLGWSPDGKYVIVEQRKTEGTDSQYFIDLNDLSRIPIPVLGGTPSGWSVDGKTLYIARAKFGDYSIKGSAYAVSVENGKMSTIMDNVKWLFQVQANPVADVLGLNIKNKLYLMDLKGDQEPVLLLEDCRMFAWSPDGNGIAYEGTDFQLHYWSKVTGKHRLITFIPPPSNKKKR